MKFIVFFFCLIYVASCQQAESDNTNVSPSINWGSCPQLEPKEEEKKEKAQIIKVCLEQVPVPKNITQQSVEVHRAEVAKCALQKEGWFNEHGEYKYEKAESEIKKKQLASQVEQQMLTQHSQCKQEAETKFTRVEEVIAQIQLYQACMDYHISQVCGIQISYPQPASGEAQPTAPNNRK
uniref:Odorant-binding n=1 Tax=Polyphagotarsonemus latus TaxID=1204166 RepID=A0AAN0LPK9_9ACAR